MERNIYLIRHGECLDKQKGEQKFSSPNICMSEFGISQVQALKNNPLIKNVKIVYVSPMYRAKHTARLLFSNKNDIKIKDAISLKEINFGNCHDKLYKDDPEIHHLWELSPDMLQFPNGDKMIDYISQTNSAFELILENEKGCDIAIVSHSITIRSIVSKILSLEPKYIRRLPCDNASITVICEENESLSLKSLNIIQN